MLIVVDLFHITFHESNNHIKKIKYHILSLCYINLAVLDRKSLHNVSLPVLK